jgi:predicted Zn-dependent peptidase
VDNQPYGKVYEALDDLAYENFAYEHSVIGSMADLDAATVDDVAQFFKTYYAPNNAVLGIVGDVDAKVALEKVRKYFGTIPSQQAAPPVDMTEPEQKEERRLTLDDPLARLARIDMAYKIPPSGSPDEDALGVLGTILSGGRSSRFNEVIVRQKQLATSLGGGAGEGLGPNLFTIVGTVAPGKTPAELEAAIEAEIERVKAGPIETWEMDKARNAAKTSFIGSLGSTLTRAVLLAQYAAFFNKPDMPNTRAARIAGVTEADVRRVASRYLVKTGRTVITSIPKPPVAAPRGGQ